MLLRDMPDQPFDEFESRYGFFHIFIIFMTVVVESDVLAVISVDAGGGDHGAAKVASDVFHDLFWIAFPGFGIYIEAVFVIPVDGSLHFFEGRAKMFLQLIEESCLEGIPQESVVEMFYISPTAII